MKGRDVLIAVLLLLLFFLSGISGLIYQVLWLRLLALVFGVTVYAASAVLASFMAGLALGSFIAGRLVDRARYPLLWYGLVEVLVGLSALATPAALDGIERLYAAFYPALPPALVPLTLVRFLLAFAVLLVPTTLMGATCRSSSNPPSCGPRSSASASAYCMRPTRLARLSARSSPAFT